MGVSVGCVAAWSSVRSLSLTPVRQTAADATQDYRAVQLEEKNVVAVLGLPQTVHTALLAI